MTEAEFWVLVGMLDWEKTGDDDAVVESVGAALARRSAQDIELGQTSRADARVGVDDGAI